MELEERHNDHRGNAAQNIDDTLDDDIDRTAVISLDRTDDGTDKEVDCGNAYCKDEREACTCCKTGEKVLTLCVSTEEEGGLEAVAVLEVGVLEYADDTPKHRTFQPSHRSCPSEPRYRP